MITSKLTAKSQTTIPQPVRRALKLKAGDDLEYELLDDGVVVLRRAEARVDADPFASFEEWHSQDDADAYADL